MKKHFRSHMMVSAIMLGFQENFASVKYGALITEMKGKIGGHVLKGTGSGGVLQTKNQSPASATNGSKLTKADAGRVVHPQSNIATVSAAWRGLTPLQRSSWVTAAPNFPFKNKFGELYTPSGYQLYVSCNTNLLLVGESALTEAPAPEAIENCPAFTIAPHVAPTAKFWLDIVIPAGYKCTIYASANMSEGRNAQRAQRKAIAIFDSASGLPASLDSQYENIFGSIPASGNVWFEGKLTKADAGRQGIAYTLQYTY